MAQLVGEMYVITVRYRYAETKVLVAQSQEDMVARVTRILSASVPVASITVIPAVA